MTDSLFFNAKTSKRKEKKNTLLLTEKKYNTVALIGINIYSGLF